MCEETKKNWRTEATLNSALSFILLSTIFKQELHNYLKRIKIWNKSCKFSSFAGWRVYKNRYILMFIFILDCIVFSKISFFKFENFNVVTKKISKISFRKFHVSPEKFLSNFITFDSLDQIFWIFENKISYLCIKQKCKSQIMRFFLK